MVFFRVSNHPGTKFYCMPFCGQFIVGKETIRKIRRKADVDLVERWRIKYINSIHLPNIIRKATR